MPVRPLSRGKSNTHNGSERGGKADALALDASGAPCLREMPRASARLVAPTLLSLRIARSGSILRDAAQLLSISQPLSIRLADRQRCPLAIIDLSRVPAEIKLADVTMKMLAAHAVKRPVQPALKQRERRFNRVAVGAI